MKPDSSLMIPFLLAGMALAASAVAYPILPDMVTIHWDMHGNPDGRAPKLLAAIFLPAVMLLLPLLHRLAQRAEARKDNLARSASALDALRIAVAAVLLLAHLAILAAAAGLALSAARVALAGMGVLLLAGGNYLGKTRSNFVIGIRNRWTLASERVWDRTHRVAGRLFVAEGVIALALAAWGHDGAAIATFVIVLLAATLVFLQVYSRLAWKSGGSGNGSGNASR